jgi:hypothetical protein
MPTVAHRRLLGTYRTPRVNYGDVVMCEVRGDVSAVYTS